MLGISLKGWAHSSTSHSIRLDLYLLRTFKISKISFHQSTVRKRGLQPASHARSSIHGARNRVGANVAITSSELDIHNLEIVDVLEIIADRGLCMAGAAFTEDEIASGAIGDSVAVMTGYSLVAVGPANTNLRCFS